MKLLRPFQLPISGPVGAVPPKAHPRGLFYHWLPYPSLLWEEPFHSDLDQPCYTFSRGAAPGGILPHCTPHRVRAVERSAVRPIRASL